MKAVEQNADVLGGVLIFSGTRVPVQALFDYLEQSSLQDFLDDFPTVTRVQALNVLQEAKRAFRNAIAA